MLLTVAEMIKTLRSSVNVQSEASAIIDRAFLVMTDEDILMFIKLGISRSYPNVTDLEDLPDGSEYPVLLLSKIELYQKLAVLKANDIDIGADNNNYLKQNQRFQHYMHLVGEARVEYENWVEDNEGTNGTVNTYDVILDKSRYLDRNINLIQAPKVKLKFGTITNESAEFSWGISNVEHFGNYKVYYSSSPIFDIYRNGSLGDKISPSATLVKNTYDIRNNHQRLTGLSPSTHYYVLVVCVEQNSLYGVVEKEFDTLAIFRKEPELNVTQ